MPRQRTHHRSVSYYVYSDDFPQALENFKEASGLSWAEIARRLGTSVMTIWRWRCDGIRPNFRNLLAFQELAKSMGLGHLLPTIEVRYVPVRTGRPFPG